VSAGDVPDVREGHLSWLWAARRAGSCRGSGGAALQLCGDAEFGRWVAAAVPSRLTATRVEMVVAPTSLRRG